MKKRYIIILCIIAFIAGTIFFFMSQNENTSVPISSTVIGYDAEYRDSLFPNLREEEIQSELDRLDNEIHHMRSKEEIEAFIRQQPKGIFIIVHFEDETQE